MINRLFNPASPRATSDYTFSKQEQEYYQYRPRWPITFAIASLQQIGITYDQPTNTWSGINNRSQPVIVSIGSGAGSDAEAFLRMGCKVYGVEPNGVLREIACRSFSAKYGDHFVSVDGNAHQLNLPANEMVDLIVCAQSLHTFRSDVISFENSESLARSRWQLVLPRDDKNRVAIWYYNLDPIAEIVIDLDRTLKETNVAYAKSKTPFFNAPVFEPVAFQHYIEAGAMCISNFQTVDKIVLEKSQLMAWLKSYSFYPKITAEEDKVRVALEAWFEKHKNNVNKIELPYIGYITQGPLRLKPYFQVDQHIKAQLPSSPISFSTRSENKNIANSFWPKSAETSTVRAKL